MAWAAASSSSSNSSRQQLTLLGYKRRPLHLLPVYLLCTSEVTLRQASVQDYIFLVVARVELREHTNGQAGVEQTELQAALNVRAVGRCQPAWRGRHAVVVVVVVVR